MDPDSGPRNTNIINFIPDDINWNRVFFDEVNGEKVFSLAYFNEYTHSLVTCKASFNCNYKLLSCNIDVNLLDNDYDEISERDSELSLGDLFSISEKFARNERVCLSYDGENVLSYMIGASYKTEVHVDWIFKYALREDEAKYMDNIDKMIEYLYVQLSDSKLYRNTRPFKIIESVSKVIQVKPITLLKKVG